MKKRMLVLLLVLMLFNVAFSILPPPPLDVWVGANQQALMHCKGDEFIISPVSKTEIVVTCRVWVGSLTR